MVKFFWSLHWIPCAFKNSTLVKIKLPLSETLHNYWLPQKVFFLLEFFFACTSRVLPYKHTYWCSYKAWSGLLCIFFKTLPFHDSLLSHSDVQIPVTLGLQTQICWIFFVFPLLFTVQKLPEGKNSEQL